jgi:transcriptional regulator with GAF, ATPase, and Fis domain
LFLDELGDLSPEHQVKILRTLEDGEVRRVGGQNARKVDVRIIAATNRDLGQAIADGDFRGDLFYRLGVITIKLPPLRHRRDDIPILAKALLERVNERLGKGAKGAYQDKRISPGTMEFVKQRDWPGNVRELLNVLTQAAIMSNSHTLQKADFAAAIAEMPGQTKMDAMEQPIGDGFRLEDHLQTIQKHYLARAMETAHGVKSKAASLLGYKNYQTLDAQLKRLDVNYDKD